MGVQFRSHSWQLSYQNSMFLEWRSTITSKTTTNIPHIFYISQVEGEVDEP